MFRAEVRVLQAPGMNGNINKCVYGIRTIIVCFHWAGLVGQAQQRQLVNNILSLPCEDHPIGTSCIQRLPRLQFEHIGRIFQRFAVKTSILEMFWLVCAPDWSGAQDTSRIQACKEAHTDFDWLTKSIHVYSTVSWCHLPSLVSNEFGKQEGVEEGPQTMQTRQTSDHLEPDIGYLWPVHAARKSRKKTKFAKPDPSGFAAVSTLDKCNLWTR